MPTSQLNESTDGIFAYYNSQRKRGETDRPNLRSMAPVLDPTRMRSIYLPPFTTNAATCHYIVARYNRGVSRPTEPPSQPTGCEGGFFLRLSLPQLQHRNTIFSVFVLIFRYKMITATTVCTGSCRLRGAHCCHTNASRPTLLIPQCLQLAGTYVATMRLLIPPAIPSCDAPT